MKFQDLSALSGVRRTAEGYIIADVKAARTGVQQYLGRELGKADMEVVNVYRPPESVFARDSLETFPNIPLTLDHPEVPVTADNYEEENVGNVFEVAREGEAIRASIQIMSKRAIDAVAKGKRQLSVGYDAELVWEDGVAPDGTSYQAKQTAIVANHLAIVDRARAGPDFRIGDAAKWGAIPIDDQTFADANEANKAGVAYATSLVRSGKVNREASWSFSAADGNKLLGSSDDDWTNYGRHHLGVDTSADEDTKARFKYPFAKGGTLYRSAIIAIRQRASQQGDDAIFEAAGRILQSIDRRKDMDTVNVTVDGITIETTDQGKQVIEKLQKQLSDALENGTKHESALAAKDAEIDDLKSKVMDAETLDAKVAARANLISKATAIAPGIHTDGKSDEELRRAAVVAKLGDAAIAGKSQAYVDARFDILAEETSKTSDQLRDTITHLPRNGGTNDAAQQEKDAHQRYLDRLNRKKSA